MHYEVKHPCIQDKLAEVREVGTTHQKFRRLVTEITMLLSFKALENLSLEDIVIETPITKANCKRICEEIVVVPILRAGIGMLDGVLSLVPSARVGFLGMFRNE
jgi:uracil phosphoribosyltransferase